MSDWKRFFDSNGYYTVKACYYECHGDFTVEQLYQAFKARLLHELIDAAGSRGEDDLAEVLERASGQEPDAQA